MKITLHNQQRDLSISKKSVEIAVSFLCDALKIATDEIILYFTNQEKISEIHEIYFNDPSPTDCISFPLDSPESAYSGYTVLGEIFICPKTAISYSQKHRLDPYEETTRYLVHSILHLIGFDDIIPEERSKMKKKENLCMKLLIKNGKIIQPNKKNTPTRST